MLERIEIGGVTILRLHQDGQMVGCCTVNCNGYVSGLWVLPAHRRLGHATSLLAEAARLHNRAELDVAVTNYPALNLYQKLGFEEVERYEGLLRMVLPSEKILFVGKDDAIVLEKGGIGGNGCH